MNILTLFNIMPISTINYTYPIHQRFVCSPIKYAKALLYLELNLQSLIIEIL